jgi:2-polyprenyl-3-methyl-5-hydroxy-6-metoxy-1,4-benzoquinol methylase
MASRDRSYPARLRRNLSRLVTRPFRPAKPKTVYASERDIEDLMQFTGLDREEVLRYLRRERGRRISSEFAWLDPRGYEAYEWFYRGSRTYVFNAHTAWSRAVEVAGPGMRCLDFGGGGAANAFAMAEQGAEAFYVDIGIINSAFARFRARKYGLKLEVIDPLVEVDGVWRVDTAEAARRVGGFDLVVCDNVLEHVPDYHLVLRTLCDALKPDGRILELTPFKREKTYLFKRPPQWDVHLRPKLGMLEAMQRCGMRSLGDGLWEREKA